MPNLRKILTYGFLIWLIPFVVSILIFGIHDTNRPLFESIMPNAVVISVVIFSILLFKELTGNFVQETLKVGLIWFALSIGIDLLMFMWGPMKMGFVDYMYDIGITYLLIPIIAVGFGYLLVLRGGASS